LKGDFPVYAAEVNLNIACKSYFHILQPFVFAKVISAASDFGVEFTFSNEWHAWNSCRSWICVDIGPVLGII